MPPFTARTPLGSTVISQSSSNLRANRCIPGPTVDVGAPASINAHPSRVMKSTAASAVAASLSSTASLPTADI